MKLTRESVSEALLAVVNQEGWNKVYQSPFGEHGDCVYFCRGNDGLEPSCLWGHVLMRLGMTYDELESHGTKSIRTLFRDIGVEDAGLKKAAQRSQSFQDTGATWGNAFASFERILKESPIE